VSWKPELDEVERRRELAREHGGPEAVARQRAQGRETVRQRIDALVDAGSFQEYGGITGEALLDAEGRVRDFTPANVVAGVARIDGRPCVIGGDDFTLRGAAYSAVGIKKGQFADELAIRRRIPLVRLLEGGGASITGATGVRGRSGYDMTAPSPLNLLCVEALAAVPVVCAALGPVAGFPAARLVASHLSLMTRDTAQILTGGPALVERALRQKVSKEELGGAQVHAKSGVVDNVVADEAEVFQQTRSFLGYLPPNVWEGPPVRACDDPPEREEEELLSLIPRERRRAYKVRRAIELIVDRGSFFEMTAGYAREQVTGLARANGHPIGVLANDCRFYGGSMTAEGAQKVRRFVDLCDTFHLPILSLVDEPGFMIGPDAERAGTIRYGMQALFAASQSEVPWLAVILRKAFGVAAGIHLGRFATVVGWPSAEAGALPVEGGVALAFGREIAAAPDPEARRRELEEEVGRAQSIVPRAEDFGIHDLIDPRKTRALLCRWIDEIQTQLRQLRGPRARSLRP
jgi:acetyl-CoA carboxylase carboxyltransferase component